MKILWFTWKDRKNPFSGGAEVMNEEIAKRLVKNGHEVVFLVGGYEGCKKEDFIDGYKVIRVGNRWTVYFKAFQYYRKNLIGWADSVIDEVNTIPFFCKFYVKEKNILMVPQLCREIWFYEMAFPMNLIGFLIEPLYLLLLNDRSVVTISESTKKDLQRFGFRKNRISIIPLGTEIQRISEEDYRMQKKEEHPTIVYLGSIRRMKRPTHVLRAYGILKKEISDLRLFLVGFGFSVYAKNFFEKAKNSEYSKDITCFGKVSNEKKLEILKKSHVICVTSVKEGWGLIVTEANSCGTPAVVYDVDGLRDSCKNGVTGIVCGPTPYSMAVSVIKLIKDKKLYDKYRYNAWKDSFNYNYDETYRKFLEIINE